MYAKGGWGSRKACGDAESVRGRRPRPPLWTIVPNKALLSLSLSLSLSLGYWMGWWGSRKARGDAESVRGRRPRSRDVDVWCRLAIATGERGPKKSTVASVDAGGLGRHQRQAILRGETHRPERFGIILRLWSLLLRRPGGSRMQDRVFSCPLHLPSCLLSLLIVARTMSLSPPLPLSLSVSLSLSNMLDEGGRVES